MVFHFRIVCDSLPLPPPNLASESPINRKTTNSFIKKAKTQPILYSSLKIKDGNIIIKLLVSRSVPFTLRELSKENQSQESHGTH